MTKNPETDSKITSLPQQSEMPRLDIQSAANWLAGVQRLNELHSVTTPHTPEQVKEIAEIRAELGGFVSAHAVTLVQAYLQCVSILHPLQQSLASIIGPCVAKALADDRAAAAK